MQPDKVQGIIQILQGLFIFLGMILFVIGFVGYAAWQAKKRKRLQNELMANVQAGDTASSGNSQTFAVKYASGKLFKSIIKVFPWEASGLLQLTDQGILFQGAKDNGQPVNLVFAPLQTRASWVGRTFINGVTAWFLLEQNNEKHYFTVETGTTVIGTKGGSKQILEAINAHLANPQNSRL